MIPTDKPTAVSVLLERCLIATSLFNPGEKWPDNLKKAIDFPSLFQDSTCQIMADAIRAATKNGLMPSTVAVAENLPKASVSLILSFNDSEGLPLSVIESEAESFLKRVQPDTITRTLGEAWEAAKANPKDSASIARHTQTELDRALGEGGATPQNLTLRSPDELLAMQFDESDRIVGDRLLATAQSLVIAGAGGIGKSRLLLQMAAACRAGLPFIGFETRRPDFRWLIIQAENSNRRLKDDLAALRTWVGAEHWPQINAGLFIHTLESDIDGFLNLDSDQAQDRIAHLIKTSTPDIVAFDSLYNFAAGDLNSDKDMTETLLTLSRLSRFGNPNRACIVLHHALTGRAGAARAVGYDRASFGRNSKVLHSWTRAQVNIAPGSAESDDVFVVTCGKMSNGLEFKPFAIRLNPESMIYTEDADFDLSSWQSDVTGTKIALMSPDRVAELCKPLMSKNDLAKSITNDCGCSRATAYRHILKATGKTLTLDKTDGNYSRK